MSERERRTHFRAYARRYDELHYDAVIGGKIERVPYRLPSTASIEACRAALVEQEAPLAAMRALETAWREYHARLAADGRRRRP